jgi:hypothetical protein
MRLRDRAAWLFIGWKRWKVAHYVFIVFAIIVSAVVTVVGAISNQEINSIVSHFCSDKMLAELGDVRLKENISISHPPPDKEIWIDGDRMQLANVSQISSEEISFQRTDWPNSLNSFRAYGCASKGIFLISPEHFLAWFGKSPVEVVDGPRVGVFPLFSKTTIESQICVLIFVSCPSTL